MGFPSAPFTAPSQSPVPVGLTPEWKPSGGARAVIVAASGAAALLIVPQLIGRDKAGAARVEMKKMLENFMVK